MKSALAMYLFNQLMERKGWYDAPRFCEIDEDEKQDWYVIAEIVLEFNFVKLRKSTNTKRRSGHAAVKS